MSRTLKHRPGGGSLFTSVPVHAVLPTLFVLIFISGPLLALLLRIPWSQLTQLWADPSTFTAAALSVQTALAATGLAALLGIPTALVLSMVLEKSALAKLSWPVYALIYIPIIFSPVVSGLALLFFWGRRGLLGSWLYSLGIDVAYNTLSVILAQTFVAMPFFVATMVTTLRSLPNEYAEIALLEGGRPGQITRRVLLPLVAPGLLTASLLTFARALGEYGATITFAGSVEGKTRTIPLAIELALNSNEMNLALGAALILISLYLGLLAAGGFLLWLSRLKGANRL